MSESLPSKRFANVDVPEVTGFQAEFVYNFFVPDEKVNDSGLDAPEFIRKRPSDTFDSGFVDSINFKRFVPRYVKFRWEPKADLGRTVIKNPPSIRNNLGKIHQEDTFTTDDFTTMFFQDNGQDQKLNFIIKRALEEIRKRQNPKQAESPLDIVRFLNAKTNKNVGPRFLSDIFIQLTNEGTAFIDNNRREVVAEDVLEEISSVRVKTQINNKLIETLLKTSSENTLNLFNDEAATHLKVAREIQNKAVADKNSSIISGLDYDFEVVDFVDVREVNPETFDSSAQVIGYIIDKEEITADGTTVAKDPIIVENPFTSEAIDLKVRYDASYVYSIRTIAVVEIAVEDLESDDFVAISFLVSSKPSNRSVVVVEERVPPPPPADFNVSFDYQQDALRLMWNFPVNTQRDIKKFQVFRRSSIEEPFELIKQFDFDDSLVRTAPREFPDQQLVEYLESPKNYYLDKEFTRESSYIYTLCAIDAHEFSSAYTTQFLVSFNRFENRIEKQVISLSGAPKAYPNAFLLRDTFVDTIKDSGHRSLKVVFNPEFLTVINNNGNDLGLLKTDNGSKYQLQLINLDLQEQQVLNINLVDRRTTTEKNQEE